MFGEFNDECFVSQIEEVTEVVARCVRPGSVHYSWDTRIQFTSYHRSYCDASHTATSRPLEGRNSGEL